MGCDISEVLLNPEQRQEHITRNMRVEGMSPEYIIKCVSKYERVVSKKLSSAATPGKETAGLMHILAFLQKIRERVGDGGFIEDPSSCYCGLPLTATRDVIKALEVALGAEYELLERKFKITPAYRLELEKEGLSGIQKLDMLLSAAAGSGMGVGIESILEPIRKQIKQLEYDHGKIKEYLHRAGLNTYDPAEAPFNPTAELIGMPQDIFDVDNLMVLASQFFEFSNLSASTGAGVEQRTAMLYCKVPLVMVKRGVYVTRMSTGARRILLPEYTDIDAIGDKFTGFVKQLRGFKPGVGTCSRHGNALIGFEAGAKSPVCLQGLFEETLPEMQYDFNAYTK